MNQTTRKRRAVRPFMPLHGNKIVPHDPGGKVVSVGAESMIDDDNASVNPEEEAAPPAGERAAAAGGTDAFEAGEQAGERAEDLPEAQPGNDPIAFPAQDELSALRAERDSYLELARRERADFDNYRKRVERDMKQIKRESLATFLKEFFNPLDDMDRVLQESVKNHSFESLVTGVRIMEENFWRSLAKIGVRKIDAMNKPFDPNLHEAMAMVPSADVPPNTVLEVYESGYKLDDFILRPARVVVSRAPDQ